MSRARKFSLSLALASVLLLGVSTTAQASQGECIMITTGQQLERAEQAVESGTAEEITWWGQEGIKLRQAGRSGSLVQLRLHHPPQGRSHLAFDYNCPAILEIDHAKRVRTCQPSSAQMRIVCKKRWYYTGTKERQIRIDKPFKVRVPTDPNKSVSLSVQIKPLLIPGSYVLEGTFGTTNSLRFKG